MIKYYCDACGKEIKNGRGCNEFQFFTHLHPNNSLGYEDSDGNGVSGIVECFEICNKCYNDIMSLAVDRFFSLRKDNSIGDTDD